MVVAYQTPKAVPGEIERLFGAHQERVLRAAYRVTGSMADAEDVAQSVFLRLLGQDASRIENVESYLYRAAINGALDVVRRRKTENSVAIDDAGELATKSPSASPERALRGRELRAWLRQAIGGLSPRSAEIFVLRYLEDHDNREIARLMGTSQAVVAVLLHHARARLKKQFRNFMRGQR